MLDPQYLHFIQLLLIDFPGVLRIDARHVDIAVAQQIRQAEQVPRALIVHAGKEVPQIVWKYFRTVASARSPARRDCSNNCSLSGLKNALLIPVDFIAILPPFITCMTFVFHIVHYEECAIFSGFILLVVFPIFFLLFSKFLNKIVEFFFDEMYN